MNALNFLLIMISSLISVAFFTVLERKMLSYIQIRSGPNKVGLLGVLQPVSDAVKLFAKSTYLLENMNPYFSLSTPAMALMISLIMWILIPLPKISLMDNNFNILGFFILSSISVYSILMVGWSSNSKYSFIGSIRSVAQMISYEVSLFISILALAILCLSFSISNFLVMNTFPLLFISSPIFLIWAISCLAETNRSPFDFAEGESELVSGFNVEYMGWNFAFIFMAEYMSMIILSVFSAIFFFSMTPLSTITFAISFSLMFIWVRGTFPRFRYDLLMYLSWKIILPFSIALCSLFFSISSIFLL